MKELLIQQIELEKREAYRKYETLEFQNFELQEKLTFSELQMEEAKREAQQLQLNLSQNNIADKSRHLLEADGIKLIDNTEMDEYMTGDLRRSIGASSNSQLRVEAGQHLREQLILLKELEKVKKERDEYKKSKEQL